MRALPTLWLLAALPALAGNVRWLAAGEVVTAGAAAPAFAARQPTELVAAAGQPATLHCAVLRLGDKAVSWVRSRDLQILTHAGMVFTADARVSAAETRAADGGGVGGVGGTAHALRIERLRVEDSGRYECQVNTDPKLSLFFNLTVLDEPMPTVVVSALRRHAVRAAPGAAATLACAARYSPPPRALPLPPLLILWHRDTETTPLSLQSSRGGVSLDTERWGGARLVSRLTLADVRPGDAGAYRCVARPASAPEPAPEPAGEASDTVTLIVGDEESHVEAMQRDQSPRSAARAQHPAWSALVLMLLVARSRGDPTLSIY